MSEDTIGIQLVRDRLVAVPELMQAALRGGTGSSAGDVEDAIAALHTADGDLVALGGAVPARAVPVTLLIRSLRGRGAPKPGDVFVANDPFVGALTVSELQLAAPVFAADELVAWVSATVTQADMGGMEPGGPSPRARDAWQEGLRLPGVKLVDGGELRQDVFELILAATRLPLAVGLDLRALTAAADVGRRRVQQVVTRSGARMVASVMERMLAGSEALLRDRLAELPDGVVRAADYLEHDGHENRLAKVDLVLTKRDDQLRLDFSGSSPQAPGFVNATRAGLHGGVAGALLPALGFGIEWNGGLLRPVEVVAPDGLVCTARAPAPVGAAASSAVWVIGNVVAAALGKLLACSPAYLDRAAAVGSGALATFSLHGADRHGERFTVRFGDPVAGGGGASPVRDGVDAGGSAGGPIAGVADVEAVEQAAPVRYLYRRLAAGSGGAGRTRGGRGAEMAVTVAGIESAEALILTHGVEVPNAVGQAGGWPGATVRQRMGHAVLRSWEDAGRMPPVVDTDTDGGWEELGPKPGRMPMTDSDVFAVTWQGGGGWGDPLERDAGAVWADVRAGAVPEADARRAYGVVGSGQAVDAQGSADLRIRMRTARIGEHGTDITIGGSGAWPFGGTLRLIRWAGTWQVRTAAGAVLSTGSTAWRAAAVSRRLIPDRRADGLVLHEGLAMTAFFCPVSGQLLTVDVHPIGTDPVDDITLDLTSVEHLFETSDPWPAPALGTPARRELEAAPSARGEAEADRAALDGGDGTDAAASGHAGDVEAADAQVEGAGAETAAGAGNAGEAPSEPAGEMADAAEVDPEAAGAEDAGAGGHEEVTAASGDPEGLAGPSAAGVDVAPDAPETAEAPGTRSLPAGVSEQDIIDSSISIFEAAMARARRERDAARGPGAQAPAAADGGDTEPPGGAADLSAAGSDGPGTPSRTGAASADHADPSGRADLVLADDAAEDASPAGRVASEPEAPGGAAGEVDAPEGDASDEDASEPDPSETPAPAVSAAPGDSAAGADEGPAPREHADAAVDEEAADPTGSEASVSPPGSGVPAPAAPAAPADGVVDGGERDVEPSAPAAPQANAPAPEGTASTAVASASTAAAPAPAPVALAAGADAPPRSRRGAGRPRRVAAERAGSTPADPASKDGAPKDRAPKDRAPKDSAPKVRRRTGVKGAAPAAQEPSPNGDQGAEAPAAPAPPAPPVGADAEAESVAPAGKRTVKRSAKPGTRARRTRPRKVLPASDPE